MRPMNGGGGQDRGNRIDNRARGNANQLHEKYKTLARDAQTSGDRVMTEYYLQFADHYFRVLSESRSRFEEQQQRRPQGGWQDDFDGGDEGDDMADQGGGDQRYAEREPRYQQEGERRQRDDRGQQRHERQERRETAAGEDQPGFAEEDGGRVPPQRGDVGDERPRRGRPRRDYADAAPAALDADRLPAFLVGNGAEPAVALGGGDGEEEPAELPRRRRTRRPRADDAGTAVEA